MPPKPKTPPSVPADRRAQIRQLAAEMFFKRGYEATTMRELAGAIQIKTASLYYFFPNKEQILFELIESVVRQLIVGARHLIAREPSTGLRGWSSTTSCSTRCGRRNRRSVTPSCAA
jgi:AcrR family transcriptional regulator